MMNNFENIQSINIPENSILKVDENFLCEWNFNKNNDLGLDIYKATRGSVKKAWWTCLDCKSDYCSRIDSRVRGNGCPYCAGQKVNHTNSLFNIRQDIAKQWHPTLNSDKTPHDFTCGSEIKVWWICDLNHSYQCRISDRIKKKGCPYCSNKKLLLGFNDLWTTHPHIAKLLKSDKDGFKYTYGSKKKVNFNCPDCGETINNSIQRVNSRGLSCPRCSDGYSYPEKFVYGLLYQLGVEFETQKSFEWARNKKYDFYLPNHNVIIETHGRQHVEQGFAILGAKTLKEEQENDKLKRKLASKNGIEHYIELDCYISNPDYIKCSILNSVINELFDIANIDWGTIALNSTHSFLVKVCKFYSLNDITQKDMSKLLGISDSTIRRYLLIGNELGLCVYQPGNPKSKNISVAHIKKPLVQIDLDGNYVQSWDSIRDACRNLNRTGSSAISQCCKGISKTAYGFKWMYKEDYEKMSDIS